MNQNFSLTQDGIENTLQTNHLSHMLLTSYLLDKVSKNQGRIINVSSIAHAFTRSVDIDLLESDLNYANKKSNYNGFSEYCFSKLANIYFTNNLAKFLEESKTYYNIKTVSLHPGTVNTHFLDAIKVNFFYRIGFFIIYPIYWYLARDAFMGAQTTLHLTFMSFNKLTNGAYYDNCKIYKKSGLANDEKLCKRFMKHSLNLLKTKNADFNMFNHSYFDFLNK